MPPAFVNVTDPLVEAPLASSSVPPFIVVPLAVPPEDTISKPPLSIVVLMPVPPDNICSLPPLLMVVPLAVPPLLTDS